MPPSWVSNGKVSKKQLINQLWLLLAQHVCIVTCMSGYRRGSDWRIQVITTNNYNTISVWTHYSSLGHTV
jgi:hypothetical protein